MHILISGGCGYIGSVLVPKLLAAGHVVRVMDIQWFGNHLQPHKNLNVIKADIRETFPIGEADAVIHLANVANDPAGDLDPKLTWEINALGMARLAERASLDGVGQFIYASSGSVYGVSDAPQVTEKTELVPLTEYNKTKMVAERVLLSYSDKMAVQIVRPGTCCGVSPRQRLDITVNSMVCTAHCNGEIRVVNGKQNRPNIHIEDLTDLFIWLLERPKLTGIWNAGFENLTGFEIAGIVRKLYPGLPIVESSSRDRRSYRMNSDKLLRAGFNPVHSVAEAASDLAKAFNTGQLKDNEQCYNLKAMPRKAA